MPGFTSVFKFPFPVRGDSARLIPGQVQELAEKVDAALAQRAVAPDLETAAALASRVTANEATLATLAPSPATGSSEVAYTAGKFTGYFEPAPSWQGLRYWKRNGVVTLAGAVKSLVATNAQEVVCILPAGFRPPSPVQVPYSAANQYVTVFPDGTVKNSTAWAANFVAALCTATYGVA